MHPHLLKLCEMLIFNLFIASYFILLPDKVYTTNKFHHLDETTLKLVQVVFRHGSRYPTRTYPNDPYKDNFFWPQGYGELTQLGRRQAYNLGVYLRDVYNDFVSRQYIKFDVGVTSSDKDRTIMSAQALLSGFYPPLENTEQGTDEMSWNPIVNWQLVPIHTIPREIDSFLDMKANCPKFAVQLLDFIENSVYIQNIEDENRDLINYLSYHMGLSPETSLVALLPYEDTLTIQKSLGMTLPKWINESILNQFSGLRYVTYQVETYTDEFKRLRGGPILNRLIMNMMRKADKESNLKQSQDEDEESRRKIFFYSAHEGTLAALLNTIGIFNNLVPSYASALIFELHQVKSIEPAQSKKEPNAHFIVRIFYRNDSEVNPYKMDVPGCDHPCYLNKFLDLMEPFIPIDWDDECKLDVLKSLTDSHQTSLTTSIFGTIFLVVILIAFIILMVKNPVNFKLFFRHSTTFYENLN